MQMLQSDWLNYRTLSALRTTPILRKMCNDSVYFRLEIEKISRRCLHSSDYTEFGHFTLMFCRRLQRIVKRFILFIKHGRSYRLLMITCKPFVW